MSADLATPRQGEVSALMAEEVALLRRLSSLEHQRADHLAQAEVHRIELESMNRRLLLVRGKLEGVQLGQAFAAETAALAEQAKSTT